MAFKEADLENLILDLIKNKGYEYVHGDNLDRNYTYEKWLEEIEQVIEGYSDEDVWKRILN